MKARPDVRITSRDLELFEFLSRARWLTTSQVQRRFWPGKTVNAVAKRARRLGSAGYLRSVRPGMTDECWHRLTALGLSVVSGDEVHLTGTMARRLPKQRQHFVTINDVRVWLENQCGRDLVEYWAEWEFKDVAERPSVVPDALATVNVGDGQVQIGVEVDCSTENSRMVARKLSAYGRSLADLRGVLIWVPGSRRMRSVVAACYREGVGSAFPCWLADSDRLWSMQIASPDFIDLSSLEDTSRSPATSLLDLLGCPVGLSSRRDGQGCSTRSAERVSASGALRPYGAGVGGGRWG